jgi:hypothetical protein
MLDRGHGGDDRRAERDDGLVDDRRSRLDIAQVFGELVDAEPDVDGGANHARLGRREEELDVLAAVRRDVRDAVALPQPEVDERAGEPVRALVEGAPRRRRGAWDDDGVGVSVEMGVAADDVTHEHGLLLLASRRAGAR